MLGTLEFVLFICLLALIFWFGWVSFIQNEKSRKQGDFGKLRTRSSNEGASYMGPSKGARFQ